MIELYKPRATPVKAARWYPDTFVHIVDEFNPHIEWQEGAWVLREDDGFYVPLLPGDYIVFEPLFGYEVYSPEGFDLAYVKYE